MIMRSDDWSRATVCPHGCTRASWTRVNPALVSSSAAVCTLSASTTSNSMLAWARVDPPAIPGRRSRPARPGSAAKRRSSGCRRRLHCASSRPVRSRAVIRGDHRNAADEMHLHAVTSRHRSHHTDFGKRVRQHCFRPRRRPTSPSENGPPRRPPTGTGAVRGIPPPVCGQLFFNSSASITRMPLGPRT
jgi:hypothetical protein